MVFKRAIIVVLTGISVMPAIAQNIPITTSVDSVILSDFSRRSENLKNKFKKNTLKYFTSSNSLSASSLTKGQKILDSLLRPGKDLLQTINSKISLLKGNSGFLKVSDIHANIKFDYLRDTTSYLKGIQSMYSYDMGITLSLMSLPFELRLSGNDGVYNFYNTPLNKFTQFNFDHKKYLEKIQKLVAEKLDPEKILASALSRINKVKNQYENELGQEILKIQQEYQSEFRQVLTLPSSLTDLSANDFSSLRMALIPGELMDQYQRSQQLLITTKALDNGNPLKNDSLKSAAISEISKMEALEKIYTKVLDWKAKFDSNPVVKELKSHLPFTAANFNSFLKKPSNLVDIVKKQVNLSSLQRLFLNITRLDIGSNPLNGGEFNFRNIMNNGINTEFTSNKSSFGAIHGNGNANINQWLQSGLNSFITNEYSRMTGIKFGSGWNSNFKKSISINFFDFTGSQDISLMDPAMLQAGYLAAPPRRDAVITWQSSVDLAGSNKLNVGLSKSFGSYRNGSSADSTAQKNNAFDDIFGSKGISNYAASIDFRGNLLKTDIQVFLKKAGLGYNNPGDLFVRRGEERAGLSISKKLLKQKLTVRYKTDYRFQRFDPGKHYTYTSFSNNLQANFRVNRYNKFSLIYRQNSYRFRKANTGQDEKGGSYTLQADAAYAYKIAGKKVSGFLSLLRQKFDVPVLTGPKYISKTWLVSHTASMLLKKDLLTLNLVMNRSDNKDYLFNTSMFSGEVNYNYSLGDKIRITTGTGYYANNGWNNQIGIRQQISGTIFKKMDIDLDLNYKKAVKIIRTELANQLFVSSSLHYRF